MIDLLEQNKRSWNDNSELYYGATALPSYGCNLETEETLNLFEYMKDKKILEIGFGSGHSLKYLSNKGVGELWGLDISDKQTELAGDLLRGCPLSVHLFTSPMERNPGLPNDYFDVVFSVYALGWTMDLDQTLTHISSYLKKDGLLIFSWDHPFMHCVDEIEEQLHFTGIYHEEDLFSWEKDKNKLSLINRKFSTYINSLFKAGFVVEALIEESIEGSRKKEFASAYYSDNKLKHFPLSFVIKARKVR